MHTGWETMDVQSVMDGELDGLMTAYLQAKTREASAARLAHEAV